MSEEARLTRDNVAILVDSTADMTPDIANDPNVTMIPLLVRFGSETYRDWIDITPQTFFPKLVAAKELPTTSLPSVGEFVNVYRDLRSRYDYVYSIHLSSKISGTYESARLAAEQLQAELGNITVVDSTICCSGIALLLYRLLTKLEAGTTQGEIDEYIAWYKENLIMLFLLDTLDYIVKGGRIGKAAGLVGSLLNIKPILTFTDGFVAPFKKARGEKKAMQLIVETVLERTTPGGVIYLTVSHAQAPEKAQEMVEALRATGRHIEVPFMGEVGSVIGTYAGPGARVLFAIQE